MSDLILRAKLHRLLFAQDVRPIFPHTSYDYIYLDGGPREGVKYWCVLTTIEATSPSRRYPVANMHETVVVLAVQAANADVAATRLYRKVRNYVQKHPKCGPMGEWKCKVRYQMMRMN